MSFALGILILWTLLFLPVGLAVHWLVLGAAARVQALPVAVLSGLAVAVVLLGAVRQAGISVAAGWLQAVFVVAALVAVVGLWRWKQTVVSRTAGVLWGLTALVLVLVQLGVWGGAGAGPPGYGTGHDPVLQTAAIDTAAHGGHPRTDLGRSAANQFADRYDGFGQLAAFTVAAGAGSSDWNAYSLTGTIAAVLASLVALPLLLLGRLRGVGWVGTVVLLLVGVSSPLALLSIGEGQLAAVASLPFVCTLALALIVAGRDRGWWAIAALAAAAAFVIAGPAALLLPALLGVAWLLVRTSAREHLAADAAPVARDRPIVLAVLAAMFAIYACAAPLLHGAGLPWQHLQHSVGASLLSWPFSWIDASLHPTSPHRAQELVVWLVGPALLAIAIAYGVLRREVRELAVVAGVVLALLVGLAWSGAQRATGAALVEYTWLLASPLLAMVCVRVTGLSRAHAGEQESGRYAGVGPALLIAAFAVLSTASAVVTGSRIAHPPAVDRASRHLPTLGVVAARDPWVRFFLPDNGARVPRDAEQLDPGQDHGLVAFDLQPFASDPPSTYASASVPELRNFAVTAFELALQPVDFGASSSTTTKTVGAAQVAPRRTTPVEEHPGDLPGGLLVPGRNHVFDACSRDAKNSVCIPSDIVNQGCAPADVDLLRSKDDARFAKAGYETTVDRSLGVGLLKVVRARSRKAPVAAFSDPLLGVACWQVPLDGATTRLTVHLRDIGLVLTPHKHRPATKPSNRNLLARTSGPGLADDLSPGHDRVTSSKRGETVTYGEGRIENSFSLTAQGDFGAGALLYGPNPSDLRGSGITLHRAYNPWAAPVLMPVHGTATFENTSGTRMWFGPLVAQPITGFIGRCDVLLPTADGRRREILDGASPGLVVQVLHIVDGGAGKRVATLGVASYTQMNALPRQVLVDWTAQFDATPKADCFRLQLGDPSLGAMAGVG